MMLLVLLLLIFSVMWEGSVTLIPLTWICLVCFTVVKRDTSVFPLAFIAGIVLDVFRMQTVGITSVFYIFFLFLILLYKKKYEIYSTPFVMLAVFFGGFFYLYLFGFQNSFLNSAISAVIGGIVFSAIQFFTDAREKNQKERFLSV